AALAIRRRIPRPRPLVLAALVRTALLRAALLRELVLLPALCAVLAVLLSVSTRLLDRSVVRLPVLLLRLSVRLCGLSVLRLSVVRLSLRIVWLRRVRISGGGRLRGREPPCRVRRGQD